MPRIHVDPLALAFDQPRPLTFVAIDPSLKRTGIAVLRVEARWDQDRLKVLFNRERKIVALLSGKYYERDGGFRALQCALDLVLSKEPREWVVPVLEWPPPKGVGRKASSHEAASMWRSFLFEYFDERWRTAHPGLSRAPNPDRVLLDPYPQEWRGPLGLACKGIGATEDERARWLKRQSMEYAWRELERWWDGSEALVRLDDRDERLNETPILPRTADRSQTVDSFPQIEVDSDMSEALCQATWAIRNVGVIGTWLRSNGKPKLLRALI